MNSAQQKHEVFLVDNVTSNISEEMLNGVFSKYGTVRSIMLCEKNICNEINIDQQVKQFAWIEMDSKNTVIPSAKNELNKWSTMMDVKLMGYFIPKE